MRIISSFILSTLFFTATSQETTDSTIHSNDTINQLIVSQYTSYFQINEGEMEGIGSEILKDEFANAQFVLLGETHDDAMIAKFTESILPFLAEEGYEYFVLEQGRSGLSLLLEALKEFDNLRADFKILHQEAIYNSGAPYFPFIKGVEDADFMQTALEEGYELAGIDQEYYYSFQFLFNQLNAFTEFHRNNKSDEGEYTALDHSYLMAREFLKSEYTKAKQDKNYPIFSNLLASEEMNEFFSLVNSSQKNLQIIEDIRLSWKIYEQNRINKAVSYKLRGELMKGRFMQVYNKALKKNPSPEFLIKLGSMHTMRGKTPLGIVDIGERVHQLAKINGSQDLNIHFMFRYYLDEEEPLGYFDNSEGNSQWLKERQAILWQGKVNEWTLIDLLSLGQYIEENTIHVYPAIAHLIRRHDYIIIPPATRDVELNYDPKEY